MRSEDGRGTGFARWPERTCSWQAPRAAGRIRQRGHRRRDRPLPRERRGPPSAGAPRPRGPRRLPDAPKAAEIEALLELADGDSPLALRNRALLETLYSGGLRSAEAVGVDPADVAFGRGAAA